MNHLLPHHKLRAYGVAIELLEAVRNARIRDCHLRDQATRAAKSACLNAAEGAGRVTRADKARCFTIARAEACEAAAGVEIAVAAGDADAGALDAVLAHAQALSIRPIALETPPFARGNLTPPGPPLRKRRGGSKSKQSSDASVGRVGAQKVAKRPANESRRLPLSACGEGAGG